MPTQSGFDSEGRIRSLDNMCLGTAGALIYFDLTGVPVELTASYGSLITFGATNLPIELPKGAANYVLSMDPTGAFVQWNPAGTGTVTSIAVTSSGSTLAITGSPITTSGTINIDLNIVHMNKGGLNANLSPSNGGIFYSTATAGAILGGTVTANRMLLSGSTSAPSWSTYTMILGGNVNTQGALSLVGAFGATFNFTNTTNVTFPTSGTLLSSSGAGFVISVTGTTNQIQANGSYTVAQEGTVTLALPQDIATTSTPTFSGIVGGGVPFILSGATSDSHFVFLNNITTGDFQLGGENQTGNIVLGQSTKTNTIFIGTGLIQDTKVQTINIGTGGGGGGGNTGAIIVNLVTGINPDGTSTINALTNLGPNTFNLGNYNNTTLAFQGNLTLPTSSSPSTASGSVSQSGTTLSGSGFSSSMVGGIFRTSDGHFGFITGFVNSSSLTVTPSQSFSSNAANIYYGGVQFDALGNLSAKTFFLNTNSLTLGGNFSTGGSFSTTGTFSTGGNFATTGTFSSGGNFSTGSTFSTTGAFSTAGAFSTVGAYSVAFTFTGATAVTFPTSGTLLTSSSAVISITGTANQIQANGSYTVAQTGAVTLALPQDIATTSTVNFSGVVCTLDIGADRDGYIGRDFTINRDLFVTRDINCTHDIIANTGSIYASACVINGNSFIGTNLTQVITANNAIWIGSGNGGGTSYSSSITIGHSAFVGEAGTSSTSIQGDVAIGKASINTGDHVSTVGIHGTTTLYGRSEETIPVNGLYAPGILGGSVVGVDSMVGLGGSGLLYATSAPRFSSIYLGDGTAITPLSMSNISQAFTFSTFAGSVTWLMVGGAYNWTMGGGAVTFTMGGGTFDIVGGAGNVTIALTTGEINLQTTGAGGDIVLQATGGGNININAPLTQIQGTLLSIAHNASVGQKLAIGSNLTIASSSTSGTGAQSAFTVTDGGASFTAALIGGLLTFAGGAFGIVTAVPSATTLTLDTSQTVGSSAYNIAYNGFTATQIGTIGVSAIYGFGNFVLDSGVASNVTLMPSLVGGTFNLGGTGANTGTVTLFGGTGAQTINLASNSGTKTISIGNTSGANVITIGGASTTTTLNGTVNINSLGNVAIVGTLTQGSGAVILAQGNVAQTTLIGGAAQTGAITLGSSSATNIVNVGTGAGATTVNIATGATNAKVVNIATTNLASTIAIGSASSTTTVSGSVDFGLTNGQLLIGSTSAVASKASLSAGAGISITPGAGTITITNSAISGGGFAWTVITGATQTMAAGGGYIANRSAAQVGFSLPATAAVGDAYQVTGIDNATGWKITHALGTNQIIYFGTSNTTTTTGSLTSSATRDSVTIICVIADTAFQVINSIGNITIA